MKDRKLIFINELIAKAKEDRDISTKDISDGHHTFGELYKHRTILFCIICNNYKHLAWKSKKHYDEEMNPMYNGDFIAGINTPLGIACYHVKLEYWDNFDIPEIERAPQYDGHSSEDDLIRLLSLI